MTTDEIKTGSKVIFRGKYGIVRNVFGNWIADVDLYSDHYNTFLRSVTTKKAELVLDSGKPEFAKLGNLRYQKSNGVFELVVFQDNDHYRWRITTGYHRAFVSGGIEPTFDTAKKSGIEALKKTTQNK